MIQYFLDRQIIRIEDQVGMLAGMNQPVLLLAIILLIPGQRTPKLADWEGDIQKNQNIRMRDALPHIRYKGVLLGDMMDIEPEGFQPIDQRGFARAARTQDPNL